MVRYLAGKSSRTFKVPSLSYQTVINIIISLWSWPSSTEVSVMYGIEFLTEQAQQDNQAKLTLQSQ